MEPVTVSVDSCLSKQSFDACKRPGQKVWWIKKVGSNKIFVDIGRNNRADRPLKIRVEFPEPGEYLVGCGPDAKEGGIRAKITIGEPAAKVEPKAQATATVEATATPEPAAPAKVEPKAQATATVEATATPEPEKPAEPASAKDPVAAARAEGQKEIAATLKGIEDGILKMLSDLGQERDSVGGTKLPTRDDTVRERHRTLDLLNRCINTDISYQQHILCRIEEARHAKDESPEDIALLFVWRAVQSLAAARRIIG